MYKYKIAYSSWDKREVKAIHDVIKKDHYTIAENVKKFE